MHSLFGCVLICRVQSALEAVQQRLGSRDYCSSHYCLSGVLDKWSRVLTACECCVCVCVCVCVCECCVCVCVHRSHSPLPTGLGTLTVLEKYGEMSGVSNTTSWVHNGLSPELPLPPQSQADTEDSLRTKLLWIKELVWLIFCYKTIFNSLLCRVASMVD